ncbi:MAG: LytTR family transcriptional regulator DNA-binding domain-containing protein [Lachnospiraceae bacterium]|nr:LytTR family transcriptional regulator DNA-binding domain-containing protein [Lachnospiraceae bacterium]
MLIKAEINEKYRDIEVHVCKNRLDDEARRVLGELHTMFGRALAGTDEKGNKCVLSPADIISFYSERQRVFALDSNGRYTVSKKLYELEEELDSSGFVRISKSEIVNFRKIKSLDLSVTGTVKVIMKNGYETYSSRRNVAKIKERLVKEQEV